MSNNWLSRPKPNPDAPLRLFCLPYAGGGVSIFRRWVTYLPDTVELCSVQLPGRETRISDEPFTDLRNLASTLADAIRPELKRPFALFGHSMGALVSYELARQLSTQYGLTPEHLFLSGRRPPHLQTKEPPLHTLGDRDFLLALDRRYGGVPSVMWQNDEFRSLMLPALRADIRLVETYQLATIEPLSCPITAYGGLEDRLVEREDLAAWSKYTSGSFAIRMFAGDHFYLNQAPVPLCDSVADELRRTRSKRNNIANQENHSAFVH